MKTIILIRHGETTKNKQDLLRSLTKKGVKQIKLTTKRIGKYIQPEFVILHSPAFRTKESALIIGKELDSKSVFEEPLRIINAENIKKSLKVEGFLSPAQIYLGIENYAKYDVEAPKSLFLRWKNIIKNYDVQTVIIVSHEGSLDGFMKCFNTKDIIEKSYAEYFNYGDWAVIKTGEF